MTVTVVLRTIKTSAIEDCKKAVIIPKKPEMENYASYMKKEHNDLTLMIPTLCLNNQTLANVPGSYAYLLSLPILAKTNVVQFSSVQWCLFTL